MEKRRAALLALPAIILVLAIMSALRLCFAVEHPARHYPTYAEARAAGALGPRRKSATVGVESLIFRIEGVDEGSKVRHEY
jgi:hypothetical protein